jgi:hypothetical protein
MIRQWTYSLARTPFDPMTSRETMKMALQLQTQLRDLSIQHLPAQG